MIPQNLNKSFTQPAKVHADLDFPIYLNKKPPNTLHLQYFPSRSGEEEPLSSPHNLASGKFGTIPVLDVKIDRANANTKNLTKIPGRPP